MRGCGDPDFEPAIHSRRFCELKSFDWAEIQDMIEEYVGRPITCDCHVVEADECGARTRGR
jgi:hypothetical protein